MQTRIGTILGEGFRVFFLAAAAWGVASVGLWCLWLTTGVPVPAPPPTLWHAHEMVFGYGGAALGGFFLTAAPSWTGSPAAGRAYIAAAALVWLAGRIAVWWGGAPGLVAAIDLAFLPVLGIKLAVMLVRRPKPQNVMFLFVLAVIWSGNLIAHLDWLGFSRFTAEGGVRTGLLGLAALIAILGGRITPAFTRNALARADEGAALPRSHGWLDAVGIAAALLTAIGWGLGVAPDWVGWVALASGLAQAARLSGWRSLAVTSDPLLWSMHLAFAALALGYVLFGLAWLGAGDETAALHVLGIGAVGGMTIAVMARASLGHSGRPLVAPGTLVPAFVLLPVAALLRWAAPQAGPLYMPLTLGAGLLWIGAFALFLAVFWPVLSTPRPARG